MRAQDSFKLSASVETGYNDRRSTYDYSVVIKKRLKLVRSVVDFGGID